MPVLRTDDIAMSKWHPADVPSRRRRPLPANSQGLQQPIFSDETAEPLVIGVVLMRSQLRTDGLVPPG
jgi:hypothetical protein